MSRHSVLLCGFVATALGLAYMAAGSAPLAYLLMNAAAFAIGIAIVMILPRNSVRLDASAVCLVIGSFLLASLLLGTSVNGATRWLRLGSIVVQPSLILVPLLSLTFAIARSWLGAIAIMLAALVLALQPDRGMSGALLAGSLTLVALRPDARTLTAMTAALTGFAASMLRPDTQGAMPFVDRILLTSFDVHPAAGAAVIGGSLILLLPAVIGPPTGDRQELTSAVFGAVWLALIAAAALGNYPTPLVGYGGSAILGYLLCSLALRGQSAVFKANSARADTQWHREDHSNFSIASV